MSDVGDVSAVDPGREVRGFELEPGPQPWDNEWATRKRAELLAKGCTDADATQQLGALMNHLVESTIAAERSRIADGAAARSAAARSRAEQVRAHIERHYGLGLVLFEALVEEMVDIGSSLIRRSDADPDEIDGFEKRREVVWALYAKIARVAREVLLLARNGYGMGAVARWRSLHELAVCAIVVSEGDETLGQRYDDHQLIDAASLVREHNVHAEVLRQEFVDDIAISVHGAIRNDLMNRWGRPFGKHWGWASNNEDLNPTFTSLAARTPLQTLSASYMAASKEIHGGSWSVAVNTEVRPEGAIRVTGATNGTVLDPVQLSMSGIMAASQALTAISGGYSDVSDTARIKAIGQLGHECIAMLDDAEERAYAAR